MTERDEGFSELSAAYLDEDEAEDVEEGPVEEGAEDAPVIAEEAPAEVRRPRAVKILAGLCVVLLAAGIAMGVLWWRERTANLAQRSVTEVASGFAVDLSSFDHQTIEADIEAIEAHATGTFRRQFASVLGEDVTVFRDAIREAEARSEGEVVGTVVRSIEGDTASAIVLLEQTVSNNRLESPVTETRILSMTLVRTDDGWKVDDVDAVNAPLLP